MRVSRDVSIPLSEVEQRLRSRLATALAPRRKRRPTPPTHTARRTRLEAKRRRGETKRLRRRPNAED
jgi:ribosome-associated protein